VFDTLTFAGLGIQSTWYYIQALIAGGVNIPNQLQATVGTVNHHIVDKSECNYPSNNDYFIVYRRLAPKSGASQNSISDYLNDYWGPLVR
jgi:hypothetical protein